MDAIAEAMYRLVTDPELAAELRRRGHENVKRFSWEKCARETLAVLESVAKNDAGNLRGHLRGRWRPRRFSSGWRAMPYPSVRILGVRVDGVTFEGMLDCIEAWIAEGRASAARTRFARSTPSS